MNSVLATILVIGSLLFAMVLFANLVNLVAAGKTRYAEMQQMELGLRSHLNGSVRRPKRGSTTLVSEGMDARVKGGKIILKATRKISREVL